jgi:hypothetical protein
MKQAEPTPRGQPKLKPSRAARLRVITSASGLIVAYIDEAANQTTVQPANPSGRAIMAKSAVTAAPITISAVRRRRKLSAHTARSGAVKALASIGSERISPIRAPDSP